MTEMLAPVECGIIQEPEVDRLLDLVYIVSGQQDPGDVRFHQGKAVYRVVVQVGILQGIQQCLAHVVSLL